MVARVRRRLIIPLSLELRPKVKVHLHDFVHFVCFHLSLVSIEIME